MKAAILAGGAGTRLYPLTAYVPKTLIPIGSHYVIEYILDYLRRNGILEIVTLTTGNESELLRNHLGDGKRFGVKIEYSIAERIGTVGALEVAGSMLGTRFVVHYGDVLTDADLDAMIQLHVSEKAICTIAMNTTVPMEYGVARVTEDGRVTYFEEKPVIKESTVSMGIFICEMEVLSYCKRNTDVSREVVPQVIRDGKPVYAYLTDKRHYDIGTFKNPEDAREIVEHWRAPLQLG